LSCRVIGGGVRKISKTEHRESKETQKKRLGEGGEIKVIPSGENTITLNRWRERGEDDERTAKAKSLNKKPPSEEKRQRRGCEVPENIFKRGECGREGKGLCLGKAAVKKLDGRGDPVDGVRLRGKSLGGKESEEKRGDHARAKYSNGMSRGREGFSVGKGAQTKGKAP